MSWMPDSAKGQIILFLLTFIPKKTSRICFFFEVSSVFHNDYFSANSRYIKFLLYVFFENGVSYRVTGRV